MNELQMHFITQDMFEFMQFLHGDQDWVLTNSFKLSSDKELLPCHKLTKQCKSVFRNLHRKLRGKFCNLFITADFFTQFIRVDSLEFTL